MISPTEVYIVTHGEYSDYGILAVFLDRTLAEEYIAQNRGDIEVWQVGSQMLPAGFRCYAVTMDEAGDTDGVTTVPIDEQRQDYNEHDYPLCPNGFSRILEQSLHTGHRTFHVTTDMGEQGAIKVANERRVQLIAMNQWPAKGTPMVFGDKTSS